MTIGLDLPIHWGRATLSSVPRGGGYGVGLRAYDHRGHRLLWNPPDEDAPFYAACDVESRARDCSFMASCLATEPESFPYAWVATEVQAKLADLPVLCWLRGNGLSRCAGPGEFRLEFPSGLRVRTATLLLISHGELVLSFGMAR